MTLPMLAPQMFATQMASQANQFGVLQNQARQESLVDLRMSSRGPQFLHQGTDQMFMSPQSLGFNSPIMFLMHMMQNMMQGLMRAGGDPVGQQGQMPFPSPDHFWSNGDSQGYQMHGPSGSQSYFNGGSFSAHRQDTLGGYGRQDMFGGYRSTNVQRHVLGHADQELQGGFQSLNSQSASYGTVDQRALTGDQSITRQEAYHASGRQGLKAGHGTLNHQVANGSAPVRQQISAGDNSLNAQEGGRTQLLNAGENSHSIQRAADGGSYQRAEVGANSSVSQRGGNGSDVQVVNVSGGNTSSHQDGGSGNNLNVVNNSGGSHRATFGQGEGNINVYNHTSDSDARVKLDSHTSGMTTIVNTGSGNDKVVVNLRNQTDNNAIRVNLKDGNDTAVLNGLPRNAEVPIEFDGGSGENSFEFRPDREGAYTLMNGDQVYHSVGEGGPVINLQNFQTISVFDHQGQAVEIPA